MTDMRTLARGALILAGTFVCAEASAQALAAPSPSASSSAASVRAQKEADRTLYSIRKVLAGKSPRPSRPRPPPPRPPPPGRSPRRRLRPAKPAAVATEARQDRPKTTASSTAPDNGGATGAPAATTIAAAVPAATAPALAPSGRGGATTTAGGLEAAVSVPVVAGALAAPTLAPPPLDDVAAADVDEADPGLIMIKSAVDPEFPMSTMRRLRKGEVEVRFEVGPDGQVDRRQRGQDHEPQPQQCGARSRAPVAVQADRLHGHTAVVDLAFNLDS